MIVDTSRRVQSVYVPVGDGVRLAMDVWLPVDRTAVGGTVGTVMRVTRYHRAEAPQEPGPEADTNAAAGDLFNRAGFALVVVDARGTGASFGTRTGELGEREVKDYGELIGWVAAQPWSNGRVGVYGTSYEGQAAELIAGLGNPHLVAVAALFSPYDPYRELFYPGGCGTGGRYARWMYQSQLKDGVSGALDRLAAITGQPAETIALPSPVKPVDGPDGPALLESAIGEHQSNTDVHALMGRVPFRDDRVAGLDWEATAPAAAGPAIASSGVPMLVRAGWLDGGFAAGALARFVMRAPWSVRINDLLGEKCTGSSGSRALAPLIKGLGCEAEAGAPVRAGSTIFRPQWSPARCVARVGRSRRVSLGLAGDPFACFHRRGISMALYMYQASYSARSMAAQLKEPQDPVEAIRPTLEDLGAKMVVAGFPFGEYDVLVVYEAPDDMTAASVAMAVAAEGEVKSAKTTRLLSGQEWLESLRKRRTVNTRKAPRPHDPQHQLPELL